jgi:hypothetical protein
MLTPELREERVNGFQVFLDVLRQQEKIHFCDIIIGDESWIFTDAAPSSIWLSLDEELPIYPRLTISADKSMLVVFWDQTHCTCQLASRRCANERSLLPSINWNYIKHLDILHLRDLIVQDSI